MSALARFIACRRGSAVVETSLVLPLLMTLGFAAADAGALFSETHRMKAGLAAGARYLARAADPAAREADAKNIAVTGQRAAGATPRVHGWSTAHVTVVIRNVPDATDAYTGEGDVRIIRLSTERTYQGLGLLNMMGVSGLQLRASHEERWTG